MYLVSFNFEFTVVVVPGEENVDLVQFKLHPGSTLHMQGQAVIGGRHNFGLQPNHNFFSTNIAHSRVFNFGAGDHRQF
jgi:hypothetical protein